MRQYLCCLIASAVLQISVYVQGFAGVHSNLSSRSSSVSSLLGRGGFRSSLPLQTTEEDDTPLSLHKARSQNGQLSLAGPYLLQHEKSGDSALFRCNLIPDARTLNDNHDSFPTESSRAWCALHTSSSGIDDAIENGILLEATIDRQCEALTIRCALQNTDDDDDDCLDVDLMGVLSRILIQSLLRQVQKQNRSSLESVRIVHLDATEEQLEVPSSTDST